MSSLVRGMSRLEEELHNAQEEKAALLSDLASVRELCVKLDSGKELTARQLTSRSMDLERVRRLRPKRTFAAVIYAFFKQICIPRSQENWRMFGQRQSYLRNNWPVRG